MKRKITLLIVFVLSVVLALLMSSDSTTTAQNQLRVIADTGLVTLGPNQVLRITATGDGKVLGNLLLSLRRTGYIEQDNIYAVQSQTTTGPIKLSSSEAVSIDFNRDGADAVRGMVLSNSRNLRVTAAIINTLTGETTTQIVDYIDPDEWL